MWAEACAYFAAMRDVLGLSGLDCWSRYQAWEDCAVHGGFRVMHEEFCIVSDFPEVLKMDDQNRPHCADGPSHRWRDGWELYYWHGVAVTQQIIERPETITIEQIKSEASAEVRRVMIERMAYDVALAVAALFLVCQIAAACP